MPAVWRFGEDLKLVGLPLMKDFFFSVFPREPRNRKRAQKGNLSKIQTLYYEKDIRFLLHEPIVWKFRDFKVFLRKLKKASEKKNWETVERLKANKPKYSLGKSRTCRLILD